VSNALNLAHEPLITDSCPDNTRDVYLSVDEEATPSTDAVCPPKSPEVDLIVAEEASPETTAICPSNTPEEE